MIKIKIREFTIAYCKQKQSMKKNLLREIEKQIEIKECELETSNFSHNVQLERDNLVNKLHFLVEDLALGAHIRSRAKWFESGERNTKYFFGLEKKNATTNTIRQLKKANGGYTTSDKEILDEEHTYYRKLYKSDNISETSIKTYLDNIKDLNILDEKEKNSLEGEINESECSEALQNMKLNKSPGSDGLSVEFYITFWPDIKSVLINSLNSAYVSGELSASQKRGLLTLLYKKNDKCQLSNWRPINLLNTDYKILAHILANRLKKVINLFTLTYQATLKVGASVII